MYTKLAVTGRRALASTEHPNRLIMWQKHEYVIRVAGAKKVCILSARAQSTASSLHFFCFADIWSVGLGGRVNSGN